VQKGKSISGFSKLSKRGKIKWMVENFFKDPESVVHELKSYWHSNEEQQKILDGFSENTITNFAMPYGVAPNFLINGKTYCIPMVIEESSVVAAASNAAKFWMTRGGFKAKVIDTIKIGQVHFKWSGQADTFHSIFPSLKKYLIEQTTPLTKKMRSRGGGILDIEPLDFTKELDNYYQLKVSFNTCDSMGANFINSVLELMAKELNTFLATQSHLSEKEQSAQIIMSILSNYTPDCLVRAEVSCPVDQLTIQNNMPPSVFAKKFKMAIDIASVDSFRATTHNKGIFNGIDAVVLATGNDFRAIESCGHTFASRDGKYRSLSHCTIENDVFRFWLDIPLAVGTVGGLTTLHPMAKRSLELLDNPNANELMMIIACTGLAQNFGAIRSLVTIGIQQGHMKMHLVNILQQLEATEKEIK